MPSNSPGTPGNAVVGQSGGPTAVINQSLVGVVEALQAAAKDGQVDRVLGAHHAVSGIVKDDYLDLTDTPQDVLDRLADTPSSGLGSSRDKPDADYCKRIFESFAKQNVRLFFYAGGNDSSDTCRIIAEMAQDQGYDLTAYHVPKTIDNDLMVNDHTPGFGSAAKFVAQAFMGDNLDNAALPGIKINVVMGRHAGFLTAASVLGRRPGTDDGPHLVYVPEASFSEEKFLADVERVYTRLGRCLIAVSEGIHDADGTPMMVKLQDQVEKDAHGNVQLSGSGALGDLLSSLVKDKLGAKLNQKLRVRADTFGYLQRSFVGCASPTDQAEAREAGRQAVHHALTGEHPSGSIAIVRTSTPGPDEDYTVEYRRIEIKEVAALTKHMDPALIKDGCDIDDAFRHYLAPIVGPLPTIETLF
ncbi:MAG: 6-phosphofructokinase [Planctomycetota bacterium]